MSSDGFVQWTGDNLEDVIAFCAPVKAHKTVDGVCVERPEGAQWVHVSEWVVRRDGKLSIWNRLPPASRKQPAGLRDRLTHAVADRGIVKITVAGNVETLGAEDYEAIEAALAPSVGGPLSPGGERT